MKLHFHGAKGKSINKDFHLTNFNVLLFLLLSIYLSKHSNTCALKQLQSCCLNTQNQTTETVVKNQCMT